MKLKLVDLVPLKEIEFDSPAPEGMDIPKFNSVVDALKWKNDLENYSMDLENELKNAQRQFNDKLSGQGEMGAEPEGGPIQQKIAGELNQIKSNIQTFEKELNTISSKIDYFDQNYLGERTDAISTARALPNDKEYEDDDKDWETKADLDYKINEAKIKTKEEFDKIASTEQKAMEKKWDSLVTTIAFKKEDPKQHAANMEAKMEYLTTLNNAGKLKKEYSDDKLENWSIESSLFGWDIASTVLPTPKVALNETEGQVLQVTTENGIVAIIEDPTDIEAYDRGNTVIGVTANGEKIELNIDWSEESHMVDEGMSNEDYKPSHRAYNVIDKSNNDKIVAKELSRDKALELAHTNKDYMISATDRLANEGSCGYGPDGVPGDTPGGTQGMDADDRTRGMLKKFIQKEIAKLHETDYADRLANSGTDSDGRDTWGHKTGYSDKEMRQGKGKLKTYPDKDGRNVWGDKVDYSDKEKAKLKKK